MTRTTRRSSQTRRKDAEEGAKKQEVEVKASTFLQGFLSPEAKSSYCASAS